MSRFGTPQEIYRPVQENFQYLFDVINDPERQAMPGNSSAGVSACLPPVATSLSPASATVSCANATGICIWGI